MNNKKIKKAEEIIRLLGGERTSLVIRILKREHYISVSDIRKLANQEFRRKLHQSEISKVLGDLRRIGLVDSERHGKYVFYTLDQEYLKKLVNKIHSFS